MVIVYASIIIYFSNTAQINCVLWAPWEELYLTPNYVPGSPLQMRVSACNVGFHSREVGRENLGRILYRACILGIAVLKDQKWMVWRFGCKKCALIYGMMCLIFLSKYLDLGLNSRSGKSLTWRGWAVPLQWPCMKQWVYVLQQVAMWERGHEDASLSQGSLVWCMIGGGGRGVPLKMLPDCHQVAHTSKGVSWQQSHTAIWMIHAMVID